VRQLHTLQAADGYLHEECDHDTTAAVLAGPAAQHTHTMFTAGGSLMLAASEECARAYQVSRNAAGSTWPLTAGVEAVRVGLLTTGLAAAGVSGGALHTRRKGQVHSGPSGRKKARKCNASWVGAEKQARVLAAAGASEGDLHTEHQECSKCAIEVGRDAPYMPIALACPAPCDSTAHCFVGHGHGDCLVTNPQIARITHWQLANLLPLAFVATADHTQMEARS
jgi:hypothetical protein